jgi:hypothetical protein
MFMDLRSILKLVPYSSILVRYQGFVACRKFDGQTQEGFPILPELASRSSKRYVSGSNRLTMLVLHAPPESTVFLKMRSNPSQHVFSVINLTSMDTINF